MDGYPFSVDPLHYIPSICHQKVYAILPPSEWIMVLFISFNNTWTHLNSQGETGSFQFIILFITHWKMCKWIHTWNKITLKIEVSSFLECFLTFGRIWGLTLKRPAFFIKNMYNEPFDLESFCNKTWYRWM